MVSFVCGRKMHSGSNNLRVAVDIGGTFTDGVATLSRTGQIWVSKSPTTPDDPGQAVSTVVRDLLRQVNASLGSAGVLSEVVHGTTLVTNTLIERKGARTALVTTKGMRDVLDIGREWRYDVYDLELELPKPLVDSDCRIELDERLDLNGKATVSITDQKLKDVVSAVAKLKPQSVAVSLLHSYANGDHEKRLGAALKELLPGVAISLSSEVAREINEFERTSTVAANAYVKPLVASYLEELETRISDIQSSAPLRVMVSSGGFTSAKSAAESPILLLESGPAAGVISALNVARQHDLNYVLAFDMGGTTAKACVAVGQEPPVAHSFECARVRRFKRGSGLPILIPSIELIEIGAGGGSVAHCNRLGLLNVGPESAGSVPGPACYGNGGLEPTVTDADLILGYLDPSKFLGGQMKLDVSAATKAIGKLAAGLKIKPLDTAWGICNVVNENMASAARIHIAENGLDPRNFTMIATGGAGPVHAVEVARKLRIPKVLIPIAAGAGSCLGMLAAPARIDRAWSNPELLSEVDWKRVSSSLVALRDESQRELTAAGTSSVEWSIGAEMRYHGQGANLAITIPYESVSPATSSRLLLAFENEYRKLYGRLVPNAAPQIITWRLVGRAPTKSHHFEWGDGRSATSSFGSLSREIYLPLKNAYYNVPIHDRYTIPVGEELKGPLILEERESTVVVSVGSTVTILPDLTVSVAIEEFD